jgi:predicted CXXCH cytochrome family protein
MGVSLAVCALAQVLLLCRSSSSEEPPVVAKSAFADELKRHVPHLERDGGFVSSARCVACHPNEHQSWSKTYHRTMTQLALPENVLGKFDGQTIQSKGLSYRVYREGDEFWAEMPDPDALEAIVQRGRKGRIEDIPSVKRRVLMTTGSHHYQTYWVESALPFRPRLMQTLPLIYLKEDDRWIPREAAFVDPPDDRVRYVTQWNHHCITCHSTGAMPGLNEKSGQLESRVGELGISCEACHGPSERHVQHHESLAATARADSDQADETIVHPGRLDHILSSEICGQCHGVFVAKDKEQAMLYATEGIQFRPGGDLHAARHYIRHPREGSGPEAWAEFYRNEDFYRSRWWEDGSILAGGREYTAMRESSCFQHGEMSCLSCHSMHDSAPEDQVKTGMRSSGACTQCHKDAQYTSNVERHTHHAAASTGSDCLNCHMPHKSYALLGGIRSHDIDSPNLETKVKLGVPNACNLCHLDQTLAWTQSHLRDWFAQDSAPLDEEQRTTSAAVLWLLKGDAPRRIIAAWHLGWKPAQEASGVDWMAPYAARLLDDPYGVIRYVAARSLRSLPGYADFEFDFLAPPDALRMAESRAQKRFRSASSSSEPCPAVLLNKDGKLDQARFDAIYSQRDNRPASINE